MRAERPLRVGLRCDAGPATGVGHLVRSVALAEELLARGWEVIFLADLGGVEFAERQLSARGLSRLDAPSGSRGHLDAVRRERLDAVVLDSYILPPEVSRALVDAGVAVLAIVDGPLRGQSAQLYVDQNIGAENVALPLPPGAQRLAGQSYALLRDAVRSLRPARPWQPTDDVPQVVVAFGGTDALGATETAVRALASAGVPFRVTVVTPDAGVRARLSALGEHVSVTPPVDTFPALLADADLVVGAAGSSLWEYCCLGRPAAVAAVVDNQYDAYRQMLELGAVIGLGTVKQWTHDTNVLHQGLSAALRDSDLRGRVAATAHRLNDGDGRVRVADALTELIRQS